MRSISGARRRPMTGVKQNKRPKRGAEAVNGRLPTAAQVAELLHSHAQAGPWDG